jgi:pimeloyl-ACP methyl ester carboxylesterase
MRSPSYTTHSVTSADGTTIGYRQFGDGPGVVLLHGGTNASQHMMRLGGLLADTFTVHLPDRRGRGLSGPYGPNYRLEREDEDLAAVVEATGAHFVFGPANGGLFALHGSIGLGTVEKVVAYEPLLFLGQPGIDDFRELFATTNRHVHEGHLGAALRYSAAQAASIDARRGAYPTWIPPLLRHTPAALFDLFLHVERPREGDVAWRDLLPALPGELELVVSTEGTLDSYRRLDADVLLLHGSRSHPVFEATAAALHDVLPTSTVVRLPGLNHDAAQTYGRPDPIAAATRVFLAG